MEIEWDPNKSLGCKKLRGFDFGYASAAFSDPYRIVKQDLRFIYSEERFALYGHIEGRLYVVIYTIRGAKTIRIISAHKANKREIAKYVEATRQH